MTRFRNITPSSDYIVELEADEGRLYEYLEGVLLRGSGIPPGPQVGQGWNHLKELRLDRGPLSREEAVEELLRWWNENR